MAQLHPAHRLVCWLLIVLAVQSLSGWLLGAGLAAAILMPTAIRVRWGRLVWRTRWLLLTLLVVLAWGVAGEPVLVDGGVLVPTFEGLALAALQLGRLLMVLAAVAALIETTPVERLTAGCHVLLRPLRYLGLDVDRAVVRMSLALYYAERIPGGNWRSMLQPSLPTDAPQSLQIEVSPAVRADWLAISAAALLLLLVRAA